MMLTNEALGDLIGLSHSAVSRHLSGERTPSDPTMIRISQVFDVPLDKVVLAANQDTDTDRRCAKWGRWFRELVEESDLDAAKTRADALDAAVAPAAG